MEKNNKSADDAGDKITYAYITFSLPATLREAFITTCKQNCIRRSELLSRLIQTWLDDHPDLAVV